MADFVDAIPRALLAVQRKRRERERALDTGRIDFGVFIGHADLSRYEFLQLPAQNRWGAFMRDNDPLAAHDVVTPADLAGRPLIFSEQASREMGAWFHRDLDDLDVVATYNLLYNAALLARRGMGIVVSLEGIVDTREGRDWRSDPSSRPSRPIYSLHGSAIRRFPCRGGVSYLHTRALERVSHSPDVSAHRDRVHRPPHRRPS